MIRKLATCAALLGLTLAGCGSMDVRTDGDYKIGFEGPLQGYMNTGDIPAYGGEVLSLGWLGGAERSGDVVSMDLWPIGGFGVGLIGARVNILWLDLGLGTGFYDPDTGEFPWGDSANRDRTECRGFGPVRLRFGG